MYSLKQKDERKELYDDERGKGIQKVYGSCHNQQRQSVECSRGISSEIDESNELGKGYGQDKCEKIQQ